MQQGDPLGPLLLCFAIHKRTSQLQSNLCLVYLDDCTLCADVEQVLLDQRLVEQEVAGLRLSLNLSKSEIISILSPQPPGY